MAKTKNETGLAPKKLAIGELVEFDEIVTTTAFTQFGETKIVNFAQDDKVVRKCFAQGGMLEFLKNNPGAKSLVLKKKIMDGEHSYNVWSQN